MMKKISNITYEGVLKFFSKMLFYQYVQYPLIFIGLGYFLMNKFPNHKLIIQIRNAGIEINNELVSKVVILPNEVGAYIFFIVLAYGYGLSSLFIQARSFKSVILTPFIFIVKMAFIISILFYIFYAFVIQTVILSIFGFVFGVISIIKQICKQISQLNKSIEGDSGVYLDVSDQIPYKK